MRLHYHPLSSYSRKAAIGIGLRGDAVELHVLDALGGELKTLGFRAMSPFGKVPLLETDDGPVFESTSILEYLEARGPRRLIPVEQERRVRHFDRLGDLYLLDPIGAYFWDKSDAVRDKSAGRMETAWALWARELEDGRKFLCGDEITLADLSAAVAVHYAETEELPVPDPIRRYQERLEAHPVLRASREAAVPFVAATKPLRVKKA
jgi:glutathione S-transferase